MTSKPVEVQVLVAEVRVLTVGSRQITLSVIAQLDQVDPPDIIPFGRVRTREKNPNKHSDRIEVVGSSGGILVKSTTYMYRHYCSEYGTHRCNDHASESRFRSHTWIEYDDAETWFAWKDMPLIVLAGLR